MYESLFISEEILKSFIFSKFNFLTELSENKSVDINSFSNSILKDLSFIRNNPLISRSLLLKSNWTEFLSLFADNSKLSSALLRLILASLLFIYFPLILNEEFW